MKEAYRNPKKLPGSTKEAIKLSGQKSLPYFCCYFGWNDYTKRHFEIRWPLGQVWDRFGFLIQNFWSHPTSKRISPHWVLAGASLLLENYSICSHCFEVTKLSRTNSWMVHRAVGTGGAEGTVPPDFWQEFKHILLPSELPANRPIQPFRAAFFALGSSNSEGASRISK